MTNDNNENNIRKTPNNTSNRNKSQELVLKSIEKTVEKIMSEKFSQQVILIDNLFDVKSNALKDQVKSSIDNYIIYSEKEIKALKEDHQKVEEDISKLYKEINKNRGNIGAYIDSQNNLNKTVNNMTINLGTIASILEELKKALTTKSKSNEPPTILDRIDILETETIVFQDRRLRVVEEKLALLEASHQKFVNWEITSNVYKLLFTNLMYKIVNKKNKISKYLKEGWKKFIEYLSERIILKVLLYISALFIGSNLLSEIAHFLEDSGIIDLISHLISHIINGE